MTIVYSEYGVDYSNATPEEVFDLLKDIEWFTLQPFLSAVEQSGMLKEGYKPSVYELVGPFDEYHRNLFEDMLSYKRVFVAYAQEEEILRDFINWLVQRIIKNQ